MEAVFKIDASEQELDRASLVEAMLQCAAEGLALVIEAGELGRAELKGYDMVGEAQIVRYRAMSCEEGLLYLRKLLCARARYWPFLYELAKGFPMNQNMLDIIQPKDKFFRR
jgi:hypothetical protein